MREVVGMTLDLLHEAAKPEVRESARRFFKEEVAALGVTGPETKKIARRVWAVVKKSPRPEIIALCEELWETGYMEAGGIACELAHALRPTYAAGDFAIFDRWLGAYVRNWAHCDMLCTRSVAALVGKFPESAASVAAWAETEDRWKKRAAAVSFIPAAKKGKHLETVLGVAETLLSDPDDMVQKGYGWALKAAGQAHPDAVFTFLMRRRETMPRTAFRYALEKLPPAMREAAMQK